MNRHWMFLALTLVVVSACNNTPKPAQESGQTEWPMAIFAGDYPDPSILVDGEDYYMTFTTNYWLPALPIWHSTDLVNWEPIGHALDTYVGTVWAPEFRKEDGKYIIYFPADGKIYAVWADNVRGPWSEPVNLGINAIDPGLAVADDGSRCLFVNGGRMIHLTEDGLNTVGELEDAYDAWPIPDDWVVECECLESPKIVQRGDWYYIVSAQGGTAGPATSHMAVVCRSRSITGPWEQSPYNPVVHTWSADEKWWSKGHGTLFADAKGEWWMVYHAYRKGYYTLGRHTLLEPMKWTDDGWPVFDADSHRPLPAKKEINRNARDIQWLAWKGNENMQSAIVGDSCYTFTGHVTLSADGEAGLLLSYNGNVFSGITADANAFHLWHIGKQIDEMPNPYGTDVWLRIVNDRQQVTLYAGRSPRRMKLIGNPLDVSKMHHNNYHGFMSLRPTWKRTNSECYVDELSITGRLR